MASLHYESVYAPVRSKRAMLSFSNTKQCRGVQSEDQASYMSMYCTDMMCINYDRTPTSIFWTKWNYGIWI